jgi:mono/diheme cytochrome c family protein
MKTILLVLLIAVPLALAASNEARSVQAGVYTAEQAERGAKAFEETCLACHQPEEFSEGAYLDGWEGQKMGDLIELIRSTMPQDNPGSLKRKDYVDVGAYLLQLNGVPPGDTEMDASTVDEITIEGPFKTQSDGN